MIRASTATAPLRVVRLAMASCLMLALLNIGGRALADASLVQPLTPPKPAVPPNIDPDAQTNSDLQKKREQRQKRDGRTPSVSKAPQSLHTQLLHEAQKPHAHRYFLELALIIPTTTTSAGRQGYTSDPTAHFSGAWRLTKSDPRSPSLFFGGRVAPFAGTGFYKLHPGTYGLTYFGPMIGLGKLDPAPLEQGRTRAGPSGMDEGEIPSTSGWLVSGGIAAVSKIGRSIWPQDSSSDFVAKGVAFDAPGLWMEARYMRVLYGALGSHFLVGVQTGAGKAFLYAGYGVAGWD